MSRGWVAGLLAAIGVGVTGCSPAPPPADSAVIITIDTWRADRLGAGGHPSVRTPHLDRFFRRSTQFADAHACIPTTLASHASILSGEWPTGHGVPRNGWPMPAEVETLPEILGPAGFATGAFVSSAALDPALGLDQGFDVYDFDTPNTVERDQDWREGADTLRRAADWWSAADGRRFLWVHLFEPHFPYDPPAIDFRCYDTGYRGPANGTMDFFFAMWDDASLLPPEASAHLESLYHAEISGMDRTLGPYLRAWEEEEGVLVIVVADHGESLREHALRFKHGPLVYPADVQVPLAVGGGAPFGSAVVGDVARTVDIPGTVLDRLGVAAALPDGAGSLARTDKPDAFAEASMPWGVEEEGVYPNYHKQRVIRTRDWAYVETPYRRDSAWFRRAADPAELNPTTGPGGAEEERMVEALHAWIERGRDRPAPTTVNPDLMDQLRSLGYIE